MADTPEKKRPHNLEDHLLGMDPMHTHEEGEADHDHDHDDLGGEYDPTTSSLWAQDNLTLLSVGIDIGSAGTQAIFSRVHLRRLSEELTSRYFVVGRDSVYQSPVALTPYLSEERIDDQAIGHIVDAAYEAAGVHPDDVDTGAVILTGEALRRENAKAIADVLAEVGGEFVCAAAGHHMESMLAAYGSGAAKTSHDRGLVLLNVDIGGGTTKLAVLDGGRVVHTAAIHIGGRLAVMDAEGRLTRLDPAGKRLAALAGCDWNLGDTVSEDELTRVTSWMADALVAALTRHPAPPEVDSLWLTEPLGDIHGIGGMMFSGGVSEYVYEREPREFGDLGHRLGCAIRERVAGGRLPFPLLPAGECIRATALGASEYSVQLSGNTVYISSPRELLPRKNLQVIQPRPNLGETVNPPAVASAVRDHLRSFDLVEGDSEVALAFRWRGAPTYDRLAAFARGIVEALPRTLAAGKPLFVVLDGDVAQTLGALLKEELGVASEVLVLDGISLWDFDYIDLGRVRMPSFTVPVTIKSLVFGEDPRMPHRHLPAEAGSHIHEAGSHTHEAGSHTDPPPSRGRTPPSPSPPPSQVMQTAEVPEATSVAPPAPKGTFDWKWVVIGACVAFTVYLAAIPLGFLIWQSFRTPQTAATAAVFTLANYVEAYGSSDTWVLLLNSIQFAVGTSFFAFTLGATLAWMNERTNTPFKSLVFALSMIPLVIPGILFTVAWILLASPQIGVINQFIQGWFGLEEPPFDIYSLAGMIWVDGLHYSPMAFLLMTAAFRAMDPSLEESATMSGANVFQVVWRVTLKLTWPAIFATILILFVRAIESFEVPALLGLPVGIQVFTSAIYQAVHRYPSQVGLASAYGVTLLVITTAGVYFVSRLSSRGSRYATITGKGYRPRQIDLGRWRWFTAALFLGYFLLIVVLPFSILLWSSFQRFYSVPSMEALQNLTLDPYRFIFSYPNLARTVGNSILLSFGSATIVMLLTAVICWIVVKTKIRGRWLLDNVASLPMVFPGLVLGLSIMVFYLNVDVGIYGTIWIMFIAYITRFMPYGLRYNTTSMLQIHKELEESAAMSGASWGTTFRRIILPLLKPGLLAGWIYVTIVSIRELSTSILLYSPDTQVVSIVIWELWENGQYVELSALGVLFILTLFVLVLLANWLGKKYGVKDS